MSDDPLPTVETYRGVGVHAFQPAERIAAVVKPAIDRVHTLSAPDVLTAYLADRHNPPEARLFAGARLEALWSLAAANREVRPGINLAVVHAHTASLDSLRWADPDRYGSLLEPGEAPGEARPRRDPACAAELEAAQAAMRRA